MDNLGDLSQSVHAVTCAVQTIFTLGHKAKGQGASDEFTSELNSAIVEMQNTVMDAQRVAIEAQAREGHLNSRIVQLELELARINDWTDEKTRYRLVEFRSRFTAYTLREDLVQEGEPTQYLCVNCYENRIKTVLRYHDTLVPSWECIRCDRR